MKITNYLFLLLFFLSFQISYSQVVGVCTALTSGNWAEDGGLATWDCTGTATVPEDLIGASTVIIPDEVDLKITSNVKWDASVIVKSGGEIIFDNSLNLGIDLGCGYTLIIEEGGRIIDSDEDAASDRLFICGEKIITSQNINPPPEPVAVNWPLDGFSGTGFGEEGEFDPLPVELLNFQAKSSQNQVLLTWSTASEINNDYFTLEKSKNGKDFTEIKRETGNGTTNTISNYSFIDNSPYLSLSYYRLSQTDYDGTTEVFPIISTVFTDKNASFSISPNPVSDQSLKLKVSGKNKHELLELNIVDLQGKLIERNYFKTDYYGNFETDFQLKKQLQKRTYIFELVSGNQKEYLKVVGN